MKNVLFTTLLLLLSVVFTSCEVRVDDIKGGLNSAKNGVSEKLRDTLPLAPVTSTTLAFGVDISKFQGDETAFFSKHKEDLTFIICKATEGVTYTDPMFKSNWVSIKQEGFIRGAYHFYRSKDDPNAQAKNYAVNIADLAATDIPPIVDFEGAGIDRSQSVEEVQEHLISFLGALREVTNRSPIIYTDVSTGNKYLNDARFSEHALWIASYADSAAPGLPVAYKSWAFWQKSSTYRMDDEDNDLDVFNGDKEALVSFIKRY